MKDIKKDIEEILIRNNDWNADDEEVEISGVEFSRETMNDVINELTDYITENYQPKTTSTDIEELRKEFMRKFTRDIFEAVDVGEGQGDVVPVGLEIEPDALPEEIWNFFLPHLSNKSELKSAEHIKREAVEDCIKLAGIHTEHNGNYCDTGEDMDWACRSKCVEMAIKRMLEYLSQLNKEEE